MGVARRLEYLPCYFTGPDKIVLDLRERSYPRGVRNPLPLGIARQAELALLLSEGFLLFLQERTGIFCIFILEKTTNERLKGLKWLNKNFKLKAFFIMSPKQN